MTLMIREREKHNECRADGKAEGRIEGAVMAYWKMELSLSKTVQHIARLFNLS